MGGFPRPEIEEIKKGNVSNARLSGTYSNLLGIQRNMSSSQKKQKLKSLCEGTPEPKNTGYGLTDISKRNYGDGEFADQCGFATLNDASKAKQSMVTDCVPHELSEQTKHQRGTDKKLELKDLTYSNASWVPFSKYFMGDDAKRLRLFRMGIEA